MYFIPSRDSLLTPTKLNVLPQFAQSIGDGTMPLLTCAVAVEAASGEFYEPSQKGGMGGPVGKVKLAKNETDLTAMAMLWAASEEACGANWDL